MGNKAMETSFNIGKQPSRNVGSWIPDRTQEKGGDNINSKLARYIHYEGFGGLPANDFRRESKARLS